MKHELWGIDGGHIGTIAVDETGGKEMGIIQIQLTVCGWANFDSWWNQIYCRTRNMIEEQSNAIEALAEQKGKGDD